MRKQNTASTHSFIDMNIKNQLRALPSGFLGCSCLKLSDFEISAAFYKN